MAESSTRCEHCALNQLTLIKLAAQYLERHTPLSNHQRRLTGLTIQAADRLAADMRELPDRKYRAAPQQSERSDPWPRDHR